MKTFPEALSEMFTLAQLRRCVQLFPGMANARLALEIKEQNGKR